MPKRPNPFGDCSPLQLKQHVGTKEVDMGVARNQNMKAIYGKQSKPDSPHYVSAYINTSHVMNGAGRCQANLRGILEF